jgi:hypothetical protein
MFHHLQKNESQRSFESKLEKASVLHFSSQDNDVQPTHDLALVRLHVPPIAKQRKVASTSCCTVRTERSGWFSTVNPRRKTAILQSKVEHAPSILGSTNSDRKKGLGGSTTTAKETVRCLIFPRQTTRAVKQPSAEATGLVQFHDEDACASRKTSNRTSKFKSTQPNAVH